MSETFIVTFLICMLGIIVTYQEFNCPIWLQICGLIFAILLSWKARKLWIILITLPRDIRLLWRMLLQERENRNIKMNNKTPASLISQLAEKHPDKPCFIFHNQIWTFRQVNEYSWRVANLFYKEGLRHGDVVALMSTNRPEYVGIWLGLSRLGVVTALINTNLRYDALRHSLVVANPRAVIASNNLCMAVSEVKDILSVEDCQLFNLCGADKTEMEKMHEPGFVLLDEELRKCESTPIENLPEPNYRDKLFYIYTSGTTGLPKAAVLLNSRFLLGTTAAMYLIGIKETDRIYNPLPLYHSSGGILGVGPAVAYGIPAVLREKFSASEYWKDCSETNCTIGQYIGEMCRYMLTAPPTSYDRNHKMRMMIGNGLRQSIWREFKERFGVNKIVEIYGSTEGNINMANFDSTVGAVGFIPRLLPECMSPVALIKINPSGELVRTGPDNLCVRCEPGEPGMFVGIIKEGDPNREYHGYVDKKASEKNVARDIFVKGDKVFVSGDIMVMDEKGYLYFKDRTGDTFRWKGENVSTTEIEAALNRIVGLRDICVYGVEIPGTEGRAGMATILDSQGTLSLKELGNDLVKLLPSYAIPLFIRVAEKLELTGTYKLKKTALFKEGFNRDIIKDQLFFFDSKEKKYLELTKALYEDIMNCRLRL